MDWRERLRELTSHEKPDDPEHKFYAVFAVTGDEDNVKKRIEYTFKGANVRAIVPKRQLRERKNGTWSFRIRNIFPGYVLLQGEIGLIECHVLTRIPGIIKVLRDESGPCIIEPDEIKIIRRLICNGEIIGSSTAFQNGDEITITDGPLTGLEGLISAIDTRKGRAKVCLCFLGEERSVELSIHVIKNVQVL